MVGRFEDVHFAVPTVEGRYAEPRFGLAQCPTTQRLVQYAPQCLTVVKVSETPADRSLSPFQTAENTTSRRREDLASLLNIDVTKCGCGMPSRQAERENAAGRSTRNNVEVRGHRTAMKEATLKAGEECGRENSADAAAVNGENAKRPTCRPRKRDASSLQGASGPSRWSTCVFRFHVPSPRGRMPPAASPFTGGEPTLVARQPVDCPRHDRLGDRHGGSPFAYAGVVQTEEGTLRAPRIPIVVGNRIVWCLIPRMQERINHCDARHRTIVHPTPWISSVSHADRVGLAERLQAADPHDKVMCTLHHSESRPSLPHGVGLLPCGQLPHRMRSSP